jgi:hypothetical protein
MPISLVSGGKSSVYWGSEFPMGVYGSTDLARDGTGGSVSSSSAAPRSEDSAGGSPCNSDPSLDPPSSPSNLLTSEEDVGNGRVTSRGSSTSSGGSWGGEDESLHHMPPKFRLKRDHASFSAPKPSELALGLTDKEEQTD